MTETDHLAHKVYNTYHLPIYGKRWWVPGSLVAKIAQDANKHIRNRILGTKVQIIPCDHIRNFSTQWQATVWHFGTMSLCATPMSILARSPVSFAGRCFPAIKALSASANILLFQLPFKFPARRKVLTDAYVSETKTFLIWGEEWYGVVHWSRVSAFQASSPPPLPLPDKRGCSDLEQDLLFLWPLLFIKLKRTVLVCGGQEL